MKHNIKTNLKLAGVCATAMMTLLGCVKRENVIEAISSDKILVRDITDGKQRIIEFVPHSRYSYIWEQNLKRSYVGDTVILKSPRRLYNEYQCFTDGFDMSVHFDQKLQNARRKQTKFDSLKCVMARDSQGKQR